MTMMLTSTAFKNGDYIPSKYTCQGEDISPPISWTDAPDASKSFVLVMEDPDAPHGWIHWVIYNIPKDMTHLDEGIPMGYQLDFGASQGMSDFRRDGYGGPCPPKGTHRYFFRLYALDTMLDPHLHMTKEDLMRQIRGHVLSTAELMGVYCKSTSE